MAMTVHCDIVSAEEELFSGLVEMVIAHGNLGDIGVLPGHAPLLTDLKPGPVRVIKQGGEEEIFYISGGFIEVQGTAEAAPFDRRELDALLDLALAGTADLTLVQQAALAQAEAAAGA